MTMRTPRRAVLAAGLLLTAAATWLLAHEGHAALPTRGAQVDAAKGLVVLSREAREALDVRTAEVEVRPVEDGVLAYATLVAPWPRHAFASSRVGGRVTKLLAQPGQVVTAGQPLAEVEGAELEGLRLEARTAQTDIDSAEKVAAGLRDASRSGATPAQTLLEAENKLRQGQNALAVARSRLRAVGLGDESARTLAVRSPVAGTVAHADVSVGKVVEPLEHLFEVVDLSAVWVRIDVLEHDLARVAVGRPVEVRLTAYPGEVFRATVQVKGVSLDARTHLAAAWAELPNPPGAEPRLLPGMSGEARVLLPAPPAPTVPAEAVVREGAERYVLVEEVSADGGSEYKRRAVTVGREAGGRVEVRSGGLYPGDRVLTQGSHELASFFIPGVLRLTPEAERTIGLAVEPVSLRAVDEVAEIDGRVDTPPDRRGAASSPLAGSVARLLVDRGQAVQAGQVVAEVVSLPFQALQADYLRAHLDGQVLEDTVRRLATAGEGAVPRRRLLDQEAAVNANRQQRDALRAKLRAAGLDDARLDGLLATGRLAEAVPVRAPLGGVVVGFDRVFGQAVRAEEPILTVHDLSRPVIRGAVGEGDLARVRVGQRVRVRLSGDPAFLADGTVTRSGRAVAADSRSLAVWVELDQPPAVPLLHNQFARLAVVVAPGQPVLAVPLAAVVSEGTAAFVFVRQPDGTFDRRPVRLGRADDRHVEVTDGLRPGAPVVVRGAVELHTAYAGIR